MVGAMLINVISLALMAAFTLSIGGYMLKVHLAKGDALAVVAGVCIITLGCAMILMLIVELVYFAIVLHRARRRATREAVGYWGTDDELQLKR